MTAVPEHPDTADPIDVIAAALQVHLNDFDNDEPRTCCAVVAVHALRKRDLLRPVVDDDTRAEVEALIEGLKALIDSDYADLPMHDDVRDRLRSLVAANLEGEGT